MKIYLAGYPSYQNYLKWIHKIQDVEISIVTTPLEADLMVLAGGEDVSPALYGEDELAVTWANVNRDIAESADIAIALERNIPMLGICRGAQLLCAVAGGKVVQDMYHPSTHKLVALDPTTDAPMTLLTNSLHHQMAYPYNLEKDKYRILARARIINADDIIKIGKTSIIDPQQIILYGDPEVVWYKDIKALGIQGHPEMLEDTATFVTYCKNLFKHYFIEKHD